MKRFCDRHGRRWDVVVGRESWGALLALFTPVRHEAPTMQVLLRAESTLDAEIELDRMSEDRLQQMLDGAEPKGVE